MTDVFRKESELTYVSIDGHLVKRLASPQVGWLWGAVDPASGASMPEPDDDPVVIPPGPPTPPDPPTPPAHPFGLFFSDDTLATFFDGTPIEFVGSSGSAAPASSLLSFSDGTIAAFFDDMPIEFTSSSAAPASSALLFSDASAASFSDGTPIKFSN